MVLICCHRNKFKKGMGLFSLGGMIIAADLCGLISNLLASHQIRRFSSCMLHFCSRFDKVALDKKRHVSSAKRRGLLDKAV